MASLLGSDLEVDKVLIWKTEIPYQNKVRQSSFFSLVGLEWCLRFSYRGQHPTEQTYDGYNRLYPPNTLPVFHAISLHRVIDGQVAIATAGQQVLKEKFKCMTYLSQPEKGRIDEKCRQYSSVTQHIETIWYGGKDNGDIFQSIPYLCGCPEVKIVCTFFGLPLSSFQLEIGEGVSTTASTEGLDDLQSLSHDLGKLLESEQLHDARLTCGGRLFPAHRAVLAARSEVFAAMFRSQMTENETGSVDVKDFGPDVVQQFLHYLYRGELMAETAESVQSLLAIADKYAVGPLKVACTRRMLGGMTEDNCVEYLNVSDLHGCDLLKREAVAFVCDHPAVVLGDRWAELAKSRPELALEVHRSFVLRLQPKTEA